jgi:FAD/FMN-containing dehydrogenase
VNIVPAQAADGRHEDALLPFVAALGGSISAEHGIGALKARWPAPTRSGRYSRGSAPRLTRPAP